MMQTYKLDGLGKLGIVLLLVSTTPSIGLKILSKDSSSPISTKEASRSNLDELSVLSAFKVRAEWATHVNASASHRSGVHLGFVRSHVNSHSKDIPWGRVSASASLTMVVLVASLMLASSPGQQAMRSVLPQLDQKPGGAHSFLGTFLACTLSVGMYVAYNVPIAMQLSLMEWLDLDFTSYGSIETGYALSATIALILVPGWIYDVHPFKYQIGSGLVGTFGVLIGTIGVLQKSWMLLVVGWAILGAAVETFIVCQDTLIGNFFPSSLGWTFALQYASLDIATAYAMIFSFMGMHLIDSFCLAVLLCSLSVLASVILSACVGDANADAKESLVQGEEVPGETNTVQRGRPRNTSRMWVSILIATTGVFQYAAVSASSSNVFAATHWYVAGAEDAQQAEDMVSLFTYITRALLGVVLGFGVDKVRKNGKMAIIGVIALVDAIVFAMFAFRIGHPLPLWIVLQTSSNILEVAAYAMLAMLNKGNVGTVYGVFTACKEGTASAASLLQGVIVDADNGGFQAAFLVHMGTLVLCLIASLAAMRTIASDDGLKEEFRAS